MNRNAAYHAARRLTLLERLSGRRSANADFLPDWLIAHRRARSAFRKMRRHARRVGSFERIYARALRVTTPRVRVLRAPTVVVVRRTVARARRSPSMRCRVSSGVGAEDDAEPPSCTELPAAHSLMRRGYFCARGPPRSSTANPI